MSARYTGGLVYNAPGGWSGYFDGSGDYLSIPDNAGFDFGSGNFTIETWVNFSSASREHIVVSQWPGASNRAWVIAADASANSILFAFTTNGTTQINVSATSTFNANAWYHIAVCRDSTNLRIFVNGVLLTTYNISTNTIFNSSASVLIGAFESGSIPLLGYVSNCRIVKGTALYTAAFTPPSGPLQAITNTSLLTCAYPTFRDGSTNNLTVTAVGNTVVSTLNPFPTSQLPNPALGGAGNGVYTMSQYAALKAANLWPAFDPFYRNVTLNLHGNARTVLPFNTDASTNNFQVTQVGDTRPSNWTPFAGTGYYSNYFDGSGDYLTTASNTALQAGTGAFTLEGWIYITGTTSGSILSQIPDVTGGHGVGIAYAAGSNILLGVITTTSTNAWNASITPVKNTWYHVALVRDASTNIALFINGTKITPTVGGSTNTTNITTSTNFVSGAYYYDNPTRASFQLGGYVSNARFVKGTAVYDPTASSITVPTIPLTAVSGTSLLTCQSNRIVDNSTNAFAITVSGNTSVDTYQPFTTPTGTYAYGSGYFDGTADYLTPPTGQTPLTLATSDFTIEMWAYPTTQVRGNPSLFASDPGIGLANAILVQFGGTTGQTALWVNNVNLTASSTTNYIRLNQWNHIAVCRSGGNTYSMYINGVAVNNVATNSTSLTTSNWLIGYWTVADNAYTGYISNFRIVKGTAVYTGNFTPSTTPLTAITNTSLLTVQTNAPTQNRTFADSSGNNWELVNTGAPYQGTLSPFGNGWSTTYDGSGDYLSVPSNAAFALGTGDFTIECWFMRTSSSGSGVLMSNASDGSGNNNYFYMAAATSGSGYFEIRTSGGSTNFGGTVNGNPLGSWNHMAVTRQSGTVRMFTNGVLAGSQTNSNSITQRAVLVGAFLYPGYSEYNTGLISNARIINGTALYTTSFTVPTAPLAPVAGTVLLTAQSNRYVDNSVYNFPVTRNGDVTIQRADPFIPAIDVPISYSGYFDGSGDYITAPNNSAFNFGSSAFTIEMWVCPFSHPSETLPISRVYDGAGNYSFAAYFTAGVVKFLYNGLTTISTSTTLALYTWSHIAYVRSGTTLTIYVNGVSAGSGTISGSITASTYAVGIGARYDGSFPFSGEISNVRIVNGTAVYTSAFTPSTIPLTAITNTALLTCQSTTFVDNSTNAFAITSNGNAQPIVANPFGTYSKPVQYSPEVMGGSGYFDSTTSFSTPNRAGFNFGTGDFTVEAWVYPTGAGSTYGYQVIGKGNGSTGWAFLVNRTTNGYGVSAADAAGTALIVYTTSLLPPNQWAHIAWTRASGTARLFVNGALVSTAADTSNDTNGNALWVGSQSNNGSAQNFPGYIGDVRIVKGTAVYTGPFVPPTAPLTAVSGTTFLCNMTNAATFDNAMLSNWNNVGNAQLSTSVKKYGSASMYFDGSGDWLIPISNSSLYSFNTSDFTIEFWVYVAATQTSIIYDSRPSSTQGAYPEIYLLSNQVFYYHSSANQITGPTLANTTWYHIAVCRSGTSTKMFVNGTQVGSTYTDSTNYLCGTNRPAIGVAGNTLTDAFNGYLDDLRVTKGVARYTTNFTPPTSQVQDQ